MHNALDASIMHIHYAGKWEGVACWALEFPSFLCHVKWEQAERRVPFGRPAALSVGQLVRVCTCRSSHWGGGEGGFDLIAL